VTRTRPAAGCHDLAFRAAYAVGEAGEVALEDYARTVTRAGAVEAVRAGHDASAVTGLHLCDVGAGAALTAAAITDIEDFARDLAVGAETGGLGWS
jgi:hypothetical protein